MCGIFAYIKLLRGDKIPDDHLYSCFNTFYYRGPERSSFLNLREYGIMLGFHRLSIMDKSHSADQPFRIETNDKIIYSICNGEIYNYRELTSKYSLETKTNSDCEILPLLYTKIGMINMCKELVGEYAIIIIEINKHTNDIIMNVYRDNLGIRPLFINKSDNYILFSSELKGVPTEHDNFIGVVEQYKAGVASIYNIKYGGVLVDTYEENIFNIRNIKIEEYNKDKIYSNIKNKFIDAIKCRMDSDRNIACMLSGGLDSSLVSALFSKYMKERYGNDYKITTISIGLNSGSTDEYYAKLVAKHIDSNHIHISLSEEEFLDSIEEVIYNIESYDITTVRASIPQYLASKWIRENRTDIKVLFIGDGSDELFGGYRYFQFAPTKEEFGEEIKRLLIDIPKYDVLRADRGIASNGLEARVPFLDHRLVETVLKSSLDYRQPNKNEYIEKFILRDMFRNDDLLPYEVLFRKKEAFSDGVSSTKKSWYQILQEHLEKKYYDEQLNDLEKIYKHNIPKTKEALYYRETFGKFFGEKSSNVIPYFWLPKWQECNGEPSARVLKNY